MTLKTHLCALGLLATALRLASQARRRRHRELPGAHLQSQLACGCRPPVGLPHASAQSRGTRTIARVVALLKDCTLHVEREERQHDQMARRV